MHEPLVEQALAGSRAAVEALVRAIQDDIYNLAVRMLWHPEDAADATQEILIQVVTHLATFRGESSFRTWYFRIASNALLRARAKRTPQFTPAEEGPAPEVVTPEQRLIEKETRLRCSLGMLQTLDAEHRLAYVVGEVLGVSGAEGADLTGVEPATYRKRLSRARERMGAFLTAHCGVVNEKAACRCSKRMQLIKRDSMLFANAPVSLQRHAVALVEAHDLYRDHPDFAAPQGLAVALRKALTSPEGLS